jgi:hypothetical protein
MNFNKDIWGLNKNGPFHESIKRVEELAILITQKWKIGNFETMIQSKEFLEVKRIGDTLPKDVRPPEEDLEILLWLQVVAHRRGINSL